MWATSAKSNMQKLQQEVNKTLSWISRSCKHLRNTSIRRDFNIDILNQTIAMLFKNFYDYINCLNNDINCYPTRLRHSYQPKKTSGYPSPLLALFSPSTVCYFGPASLASS